MDASTLFIPELQRFLRDQIEEHTEQLTLGMEQRPYLLSCGQVQALKMIDRQIPEIMRKIREG